MREIESIKYNGYNVISLFAGCGGSCLGYRMAGFRVLWASEFIPAACETYRANHPGAILDARDIRKVQPGEILAAVGKKVGEIDLLDGSPPCSSFSTAGKREAGWGKMKAYSDTRQRTDDLFFEYARILEGLKPRAFVAENVSGLVKGTAKGYFLEILARLKGCGYRVEARVLDAQWLGVPQARQRLFFVGVRDDLGRVPAFPKPLGYRYSVRDALPWIARVMGGNGAAHDSKTRGSFSLDEPTPTILAGGTRDRTDQFWVEAEADMTGYAVGREWDKLAPGAKSDKYQSLVKPRVDAPCPTITQRGGDASAASVAHPTERRKFSIAELRRICGFPDDFVLTGSYSQKWERLGRAVPPVMMNHLASIIRDQILKRC